MGLLVQGGAATQAFPAWDLSQLRYFGVLQRIAACFALASLVVLYIPDSRPHKEHVRRSFPAARAGRQAICLNHVNRCTHIWMHTIMS